MMDTALKTALLMTTLAGLSTGLGGLLVLWRRPGSEAVSLALGFAGGVMLAVSLADLIPAGLAWYLARFPPFGAGCAAGSLVLAGMAVAGLMEGLLPIIAKSKSAAAKKLCHLIEEIRWQEWEAKAKYANPASAANKKHHIVASLIFFSMEETLCFTDKTFAVKAFCHVIRIIPVI